MGPRRSHFPQWWHLQIRRHFSTSFRFLLVVVLYGNVLLFLGLLASTHPGSARNLLKGNQVVDPSVCSNDSFRTPCLCRGVVCVSGQYRLEISLQRGHENILPQDKHALLVFHQSICREVAPFDDLSFSSWNSRNDRNVDSPCPDCLENMQSPSALRLRKRLHWVLFLQSRIPFESVFDDCRLCAFRLVGAGRLCRDSFFDAAWAVVFPEHTNGDMPGTRIHA